MYTVISISFTCVQYTVQSLPGYSPISVIYNHVNTVPGRATVYRQTMIITISSRRCCSSLFVITP